jgi:hypothetical protein
MFQQTVVTVSNADQPPDTIRWGETVNKEEIEDQTTNSDQQSIQEGEVNRSEPNRSELILVEPNRSEVYLYPISIKQWE